MALAKRGSSRITVAGVEYRWVVSGDSGVMHLIVELCEKPGQRLHAGMSYDERLVASGASDSARSRPDQCGKSSNSLLRLAGSRELEDRKSSSWMTSRRRSPLAIVLIAVRARTTPDAESAGETRPTWAPVRRERFQWL